MKGAKGLLISITGGRDLTLFEVDEAATRIREEVDPDANIILGATFEEALEGVIRVSVVATGIENAVNAMESEAADQRLAELKNRLRGPVARPASQPARPVTPSSPATAPQMRPAATGAQPARMQEPGITVAPLDPGPMNYGHEIDAEHRPMHEETDARAEAPFIPPPAEAPSPRIPRVEDFPPVVQRQIAERQRGARPEHEDRGPMSLLRRLAGVGLGRREENPIGAGQPARAPQLQRPIAKPQQQRQIPPQPRVTQPAPRQQSPQDGLYTPRQGDLDQHGRPLPNAKGPQHDDDLEIPAFLRRQAN
jgi:cell division protein FtsZ